MSSTLTPESQADERQISPATPIKREPNEEAPAPAQSPGQQYRALRESMRGVRRQFATTRAAHNARDEGSRREARLAIETAITKLEELVDQYGN